MAQNGTETAREMARTKRLQDQLPKGIAIGEWSDGRAARYFVRYGPTRKVLSFQLEGHRNDQAEHLADLQHKGGVGAVTTPGGDAKAFLQFQEETKCTVPELRRLWTHFSHTLRSTLTVPDAVQAYMELRGNEGLAVDSIRHMRTILGRFADRFAYRLLVDIQADDIRGWLTYLQVTRKFEQVTLRHHRKEVHGLYERAILEKWTLENPCSAVVPPKLISKETAILALLDAQKLFQAAQGSLIAGKLALEAFGGLRVSSAARLKPEEIDFEHRGLTFPGSKHKLSKRFYVDGFPENLFAWLKVPTEWDMSESWYDQQKSRVFARANVVNPGNVLRHSFATYHLAAYGDAAKTASLLTHRNTHLLFTTYRGKGVPQDRGKLYFQIMPE